MLIVGGQAFWSNNRTACLDCIAWGPILNSICYLGFRGFGFRGFGFRGLGFRGLGFRGSGFRGLGLKSGSVFLFTKTRDSWAEAHTTALKL